MDDLPQRIEDALREPKFRRVRARGCAPGLAYGRHRGPAPADARAAAVAITFLQHPDRSWSLPLTLRPLSLRHHAGQICFPGGRIEPGETPVQAALREFQEELGYLPGQPRQLGEFEPLYIYASNHLVFPIIFAGQAPESPWRPDPSEVDAVIEMPLDSLRSPDPPGTQKRDRQILKDDRVVGRYQFEAAAYRFDQQGIWGATAMMLNQLATILAPRR
ncbi:MAG: CoA pyrophosphatase [Planctomycetaceae bacterium]|nr:MAG: CoA pyrophosphatase [Planctomycetaceae bacterium]